MIAITESNRAQLEQFHFIQSALLTYRMLTHKGECLQQRERILKKKKSHVFLFIHIFLTVSQRGNSILLQCPATSLQASGFFNWTIADKCGGRMFFLF